MLQRGKDAQWEKRDSLTVYLGTNLQAEKRGNEMIRTYGKRILSGVLTGCMPVSYTHLTLPTNSLV